MAQKYSFKTMWIDDKEMFSVSLLCNGEVVETHTFKGHQDMMMWISDTMAGLQLCGDDWEFVCKERTYIEKPKDNNLDALFNSVVEKRQSDYDKRRAEGKAKEREWMQRTQEFFAKIEFLNQYGFGFHISEEKETGCTSYPDEHRIYIRPSKTHGRINVMPNGDIHCSCYVGTYDKTFKSVEEFVKAMAECIRMK